MRKKPLSLLQDKGDRSEKRNVEWIGSITRYH